MSPHLISAIKWNCNKTPGLDAIQAAPNGAAPGRAHPYLEQRLQTAFENLAFADCNSGATPTFDVVCNKARAVLNYSYLTSFSFSFFGGGLFPPQKRANISWHRWVTAVPRAAVLRSTDNLPSMVLLSWPPIPYGNMVYNNTHQFGSKALQRPVQFQRRPILMKTRTKGLKNVAFAQFASSLSHRARTQLYVGELVQADGAARCCQLVPSIPAPPITPPALPRLRHGLSFCFLKRMRGFWQQIFPWGKHPKPSSV